MADYEFNLPFPPSVNRYWRSFGHRQIISKNGREYRINVESKMKELGLFGELIHRKVKVSLVLHRRDKRKYDVDNFTKALFDALTHSNFWIDDEQVYELSVIKGEKIQGGNVEFKVNLLGDE